MDAEFIRKKPGIVLIFMLLCGIFFIALFFLVLIGEPEEAIGALTFLFMGILFSAISILAMLSNHTAYIHLDEKSIKGRYHLFGRIDCAMDEVAFVAGRFNGLDIFIKGGKRHSIVGLSNPEDIAHYILRQIFTVESESPDTLRAELLRQHQARKKMLVFVVVGMAMLIINPILTALLTGWKEMHEFSRVDWIIFYVMGAVGVLNLGALLVFAKKSGMALMRMLHLRHRLQGACIVSQPLPAQARRVYTDECNTGRAVVCGYPKDESVYYCIQGFGEDFQLETSYHSEVYENEDALFADTEIQSFFDISEHFPINTDR